MSRSVVGPVVGVPRLTGPCPAFADREFGKEKGIDGVTLSNPPCKRRSVVFP